MSEEEKKELGAIDLASSREMNREFDIVEEFESTLDDIDKAFELFETDTVPDKITYLRFLVKDLDDLFSREHESLRFRNFVIKRSK
ncbi:MAG: hypothetical protein JRG79_13820 [Deltaproteobacteria bacterium]|nr:hypothetical protein [Deltaproteobacteria bacterium]MBW1943128.1 hypothetical protein [Deltaproteobacteria bacterium]MBW2207982.1 hypothetical protein [Deltaproteobacteria bacterium]